MTLTAAITAGIGVLIGLWAFSAMMKGRQVAHLKATGVLGQPAILSMQQTGMYLNEQPQIELALQITTGIHGTYRAKKKDYVPLMLLGTLTSGRPLPVRVDRVDRTKFTIGWENSLRPTAMPATPATPGAQALRYASDAAATGAFAAAGVSREQILATGRDGEAKVVSATPTGETDAAGNPVFDFVIEVEIPGAGRVQAPARAGVPPDRIARLAPGKTVPMKIDRDNPAAMAVDWERA